MIPAFISGKYDAHTQRQHIHTYTQDSSEPNKTDTINSQVSCHKCKGGSSPLWRHRTPIASHFIPCVIIEIPTIPISKHKVAFCRTPRIFQRTFLALISPFCDRN